MKTKKLLKGKSTPRNYRDVLIYIGLNQGNSDRETSDFDWDDQSYSKKLHLRRHARFRNTENKKAHLERGGLIVTGVVQVCWLFKCQYSDMFWTR